MAVEAGSFRELERANRRQAAVLIGGQILVFALFGFGLDLIFHGMFFRGGSLGFPWFTAAAVCSAVLYTLRTYYGGPGMVLGAVAAFPIPDDEPKKRILLDVAREMAVAARLLEPQVYMIDDPAPNALAVGRNPHDSVICVTRGLVNGMDREELQGVIAHEMAHIRSYDAWLATLVTATRLARIGSFPGLLYQALTRGTGVLLSRESEYLADGAAVEFTRNPTGLIRALQQIARTAAPMKHASPAVAPLFIADPMSSASGGGSRSYQEYLDELTRIRSQADKSEEQREAEATKFATDEYPRNALQQALSTHPALADRIARLQQLVKAAGDSKGEPTSDEIAASRSESARFVTNLSTSDPEMAAKVVESALLATPMGREMMDEKLGGELSSEGLASVEPSGGARKGTGDLSKGSTGELRLADAGDLNGASEGNGKLDPAAREALELEAIRKTMAEVLPQTRPYRRETTIAGAKSSSFGVMLVFWLVMAMSAGAIAMVVFAK
jgi:heat shock protein HtpX